MDELLFETLGNMPLSAQLYTKAGVDKVVNDAIVGGVTSLLKFVGISSTDPITVGPTVDGITSYAEGNVVLWKPEGSSEYSEYVYATVDGALKWERLGDASRIGQLEAEVAKKADISALNAVDTRLSAAEGEIDALQGEIVKKADISALNDGLALKADLTALNAVDGRLSTAEGEIDALQGEIATKANASDVTPADKLLVLNEDQYYAGSYGIFLQEEGYSDSITIRPAIGISGDDGQGGSWGIHSGGAMISDGTNTTNVDATGISINENGIFATIGASGLVLNGDIEIQYPSATGQLATVEEMAAKYDGAAEKADILYGAAATATASLADVTTVNGLISVLETFFGTVGA